jgi:hypothetical protein
MKFEFHAHLSRLGFDGVYPTSKVPARCSDFFTPIHRTVRHVFIQLLMRHNLFVWLIFMIIFCLFLSYIQLIFEFLCKKIILSDKH